MIEHNGKRYQLFARPAKKGELVYASGCTLLSIDVHQGGVYKAERLLNAHDTELGRKGHIAITDDKGDPNSLYPNEYMVMVPEPVNQLQGLVQAAHQNAVNKGWWKNPAEFGSLLMLVTSELSEALEDFRNGHEPTEEWYEEPKNSHGKSTISADKQLSPEWKPCGIPSELADVVIRVMDICGHYGIDLERAIQEKMAYNATRSERHGGKVL